MDSFEELKAAGFIGFKPIAELIIDSSCLPLAGGVYLILMPEDSKLEFIPIGSGGYFKGKNPNVPVEILELNWVSDSKIIYIGKATCLRERLNQYFKFGQGKNIGHYGGRYIWQLKNSASLIVCWKQTNNEDPRLIESQLIRDYKAKHRKRPFANLCD